MKANLIILLFLSFTACAQNNSKQIDKNISTKQNSTMEKTYTEDEKAALATSELLTELMIAKDLSGMKKIMDENFTLTHITGYVQPKEEWFHEIETESMKYYGFQPVSRKVTVNGNKAQVIQQNRLDARIWGTRNNWRLQQIMKLEKRDNQWIILQSVASTF